MKAYILDKDAAVGQWVTTTLREIGIEAEWVPSVAGLLDQADLAPPYVCLIALRPPVNQALALIAELTQEPRFDRTAFIPLGPAQYKRAAFEAGADDYLTTPPDVIELRKRVRLYLDRAALEDRVRTETHLTQEMQALGAPAPAAAPAPLFRPDEPPVTLLEHAATLTRQSTLLTQIVQHLHQAIVAVDPVGVVLYANPAWETLTGQSASAQIGQPIPWPPPTGDPAADQALADRLAARQEWQGKCSTIAPNSKPRVLETTITPLIDAASELAGFVMAQADVTHRVTLDHLKTRFVTDAANELRTPVTNIRLRQYLLRQAPPDQHAVHIQALEREIERLALLVDALLELARLDADSLVFAHVPVDLNRLLAEARVRFEPTAQQRGITLSTIPDHRLPPILGDSAQLARVLGILIENALDYTPEGGHIEISVGHETWTGGDFATISISDTGLGIEPEALPHIFDRFYRGARARDSAVRGVGLGLAIAHEIIARHNGTITVESQVNQGSQFTVWLPLSS